MSESKDKGKAGATAVAPPTTTAPAGKPAEAAPDYEAMAAAFKGAAVAQQRGSFGWTEGEFLFGRFDGIQPLDEEVAAKIRENNPKIKPSDLFVITDLRTGEVHKKWSFGLLKWHLDDKKVKPGDLIGVLYEGQEVETKFHRCRVSTAADLAAMAEAKAGKK
jgi:hypothetical protein